MDEMAIATLLSLSNQSEASITPQPIGSSTPALPTCAASSAKATPSKSLTVWTEEMNVMLCREVELINPYQYKDRTKERGKLWDEVASNLQNHGLKVSKRSVRDRFNLLKQQVSRRNAEEKRASGISVELTASEAEVSQIVEDILEVETEQREKDADSQQKEEARVRDGVEMRKRALETFTETSKRNKDDQTRKKRNTGSDANEYLLRKLELDMEFRREEAVRRQRDEERKKEKEDREDERRRQREEREEERLREREEREERRRQELEEREERRRKQDDERRRQEEERRRRDDEARERRYDFMQQQILRQNEMLLKLLGKQ